MAINIVPLNSWSDSNRLNGFTLVVSGATAGNVLIGSMEIWENEGTIPPVPANYDLHAVSDRASGSSSNSMVFSRVATGDSGDDLVFTFPGGQERYAVAVAEYEGVSTDIDRVRASSVVMGAPVTSIQAGSITPQATDLLLASIGVRDTSKWGLPAFNDTTWSDTYSYPVRANLSSSTRPGVEHVTRVGSTVPIAPIATGDTGDEGTEVQIISLAFKEAGGGGGTPPTNVSGGGPYTGNPNVAIQLSGSFTPGSGTSHTYQWSTGFPGTFSSATAQNPTFTPTTTGTGFLTFTVTPDDGAPVASPNASLTVNDPSPGSVTFNGPIPDQLTFTGVPYSIDFSIYFSGANKVNFTYEAFNTPGTMDPNTGILSGIGSDRGRVSCTIVATDPATTDSATSNEFAMNTTYPAEDGGEIYNGSTLVNAVRAGSDVIEEIYRGSTLIWNKPETLFFQEFPLDQADVDSWTAYFGSVVLNAGNLAAAPNVGELGYYFTSELITTDNIDRIHTVSMAAAWGNGIDTAYLRIMDSTDVWFLSSWGVLGNTTPSFTFKPADLIDNPGDLSEFRLRIAIVRTSTGVAGNAEFNNIKVSY